MKSLFVMLFLGVSLTSFSQFDFSAHTHSADSVHQAYEETMDSVFQNVDFSYIPSGILYDRGFPFIDIELFDGTITDNSESSTTAFGLAYASISTMVVDTTKALPLPTSYRNVLDTITGESDVILLSGLHQEYHIIDTLSITDSLLSVSGRNLSDIFPRARSPYLKQDLFMVAPATHNLERTSFSFKLDSNLFYSNTDKVIDEIAIDIGKDSGYVEINFNELIPVNYTEAGKKVIKVKIQYTDSSEYFSHFTITTPAPGNLALLDTYDIIHLIEPTPHPIGEPEKGRGGGTIKVFLGCGHDRIEKPFIWAEGYNPVVGKLDLSLNVEEFLDRIEDEETTIEGGGGRNFRDYLVDNGYDIILLEYLHGGDYLTRNAEFIEESIRWINIQKHSAGSNEKNIILGQSMGGPCTALALKEMEADSEDHEVGTYVIFDSPIMGVNVPLCSQASLMDIAFLPVIPAKNILLNYVNYLDWGTQLLYLPATRTMVKYFIEYDDILDDTHIYDDFYGNLHNDLGGLPENCEIITIANGSKHGSDGKHDFDPGELILRSNNTTFTVLNLLGAFAQSYADTGAYHIIETNAVRHFGGGLFFSSGLKVQLDIKGYAVPDMISGEYYNSKIDVQSWWAPLHPIIFSTESKSVSGVPGIDSAPGGFVGLGNQGIVLNPDSLGALMPDVFKLTTWCFTPTVSVLNYHGPYTDNRFHDPLHNFSDTELEITSGNARSIDNYVSNSNIVVFDGGNYRNTAHTWFTKENSEFLYYHLFGSDLMDGVTSLELGETFNYGKAELDPDIDFETSSPRTTGSILDHSITIDDTYLAINNSDNIGHTPSPYTGDDIPGATPSVSSFLLNIGNVCDADDPITVTIQNDGEMILGDGVSRVGAVNLNEGHSIIVKDGGVLRIEKNGTLKVMTNANLVIEDGGTLILEDGAALITEPASLFILHEGNEVHLRGSSSFMDISGGVRLYDNADFNPKHDGVASGHIVWSQYANIDGGEGSTFQINGDSPTDPMFTINNNAKLAVNDDMGLLRFSNCQVLFRSNELYSIRTLADFESMNVNYNVQSNVEDAEFHPMIYLQDEALISHSTFTDVLLKAEPILDMDEVAISVHQSDFSSTYDRGKSLVEIIGGNLSMSYCDLSGYTSKGLELRNLNAYSTVNYSTFTGYDSGIGGSSSAQGIYIISASELLVKKSDFEYGSIGIKEHFGQLTLRCNDFDDFHTAGVFAAGYSRLEMGTGGNGGYNVFTNMKERDVVLNGALYLGLNDGYNYFVEPTDGIRTIEGTLISDLPPLLMLPGHKNQWNPANTVPTGDVDIKNFDTGFGIGYSLTSPESASCGVYSQPDSPTYDIPGGGGSYFPLITVTGVANPMRLDSAITYGVGLTELWDSTENDLSAITVFHDVLMHQYTQTELQDTVIRWFLDRAYQNMKFTVGHALFTGDIKPSQNQTGFSTPVQKFVDVLNRRSEGDTISLYDYHERFYLELDKAHLLRSLGHTDKGFDILKNLDLCVLDSNEQVAMNYWKFVFEEEDTKQSIGVTAYEKDTVYTDSSSYHQPTPSQASEYYFGSVINSPTNITFRNCSGGTKAPQGESQNESYPFRLYPNPSQGEIQLEYDVPEKSTTQLFIYSIEGKLIQRVDLQGGHRYETIDISFVRSGIYVYKLHVDGMSTQTGRIAITH